MSAREQRGSAMVIALLVTFILSLLGVSFLMMAQTESRIAQNEWMKEQAFFAAEAGAPAVRGWFDDPQTGLEVPTPAEVDRAARRILDETDPDGPTASLPTAPIYRQGTGSNPGDPLDDTLFDRPYRGTPALALMGRREFPDVQIDLDGSVAEQAYLRRLSTTLFGTDEDPYRSRISRIAIYAPPYVQVGAGFTRFGMGTAEVIARVYDRDEAGDDRNVMAEQRIRVVLNELPYGTPVFGPLHTCADLRVYGDLNVHWGTVTVQGGVNLSTDPADTPSSIPRQVPPGPRLERLWNATSEPAIAAWETGCDGVPVDDPWARVISRGAISGPPPLSASTDQPWTESSPAAAPCGDRSNLVQNHPLVGCPRYDYAFWKNVAASGRKGVFYYVHDGADRFLLDGVGDTPRTFAEITDNETGLFFFDTADRLPPHDDDNDGVYENLTPAIEVTGVWNARGFIYLNAGKLTLRDVGPGGVETFRAPGELQVEIGGSPVHVDVDYPTALPAAVPLGPGPDAGHNTRGPGIASTSDFSGIVYVAGSLEAVGLGRFYGSFIAHGLAHDPGQPDRGVVLGSPGDVGPDFYWDAGLVQGWPPAGLPLPRVAVRRWSSSY